jgi:hypothetical protein
MQRIATLELVNKNSDGARRAIVGRCENSQIEGKSQEKLGLQKRREIRCVTSWQPKATLLVYNKFQRDFRRVLTIGRIVALHLLPASVHFVRKVNRYLSGILNRCWAAVALALVLGIFTSLRAEDAPTPRLAAHDHENLAVRVEFSQEGRTRDVKGRIVLEAADGGMLLEGDDGMLWTIEGKQVRGRKELDSTFKPLTRDELAEKMIAELPAGFRVHTTPHYVVCYNTSRAYATWTSSLLERLYKAFTNYWENQGLEIREPEFPLPVMVFASRQMYDAASREDLPGGTGNIVGFYSLRTNCINMFDLTGAEAVRDVASSRSAGLRRGSMRELNQMLSQPAAVPLVATIVHEATHQIAFNCGLQTRYADIPLWQCEGMAVYFEAPDLTSTRGWRGIGRVNYPRLDRFQRNLPNWNDKTLERLISGDDRLRDPQTAVDAYADAWALNYYLIRFKSREYADYLKALSEKLPLIHDEAETRTEEFREHFGDLKRLEQDFLKQMSRVK